SDSTRDGRVALLEGGVVVRVPVHVGGTAVERGLEAVQVEVPTGADVGGRGRVGDRLGETQGGGRAAGSVYVAFTEANFQAPALVSAMVPEPGSPDHGPIHVAVRSGSVNVRQTS